MPRILVSCLKKSKRNCSALIRMGSTINGSVSRMMKVIQRSVVVMWKMSEAL